jgi:hypothetical protein
MSPDTSTRSPGMPWQTTRAGGEGRLVYPRVDLFRGDAGNDALLQHIEDLVSQPGALTDTRDLLLGLDDDLAGPLLSPPTTFVEQRQVLLEMTMFVFFPAAAPTGIVS